MWLTRASVALLDTAFLHKKTGDRANLKKFFGFFIVSPYFYLTA
jgi:hypothetical protein